MNFKLMELSEAQLSLESFFIFLGLKKKDGHHCGILIQSECTSFLHFESCQIKKDGLDNLLNSYFFVGVEKLNIQTNSKQRDILPTIEAMADLVSSNNETQIIYSFLYDGVKFDELTGLLENYEKGLSCATFVVAFFETIRIPLIEFHHWPIRDEDNEEMKNLLVCIADQIGYESIHNNLPCPRIRPAEITASALYDQNAPATFSFCKKNGEKIDKRIKNN